MIMRTSLDYEESSDQERIWESQDPSAGARQAGSVNRKWECPDLPAGGRQARLPQARDMGDPDIDLI